MRILSKDEMRALDDAATNEYNIPSLLLMENAGRSLYEFITWIFKERETRKISIISGKGNNGGDGIVLARYLLNHGIDHELFLLAEINEYKKDAKTNLDIYTKSGGVPTVIEKDYAAFRVKIQDSDIVVDAIFGTGLSNEIDGFNADVINLVNSSKIPVMSVDIPSGIDGTSGLSLGTSINATWTVTFGSLKRGFFQNDGIDKAGEIIVADIGLPRSLADHKPSLNLLRNNDVRVENFKRTKNTHKGTYGHLLIVAGSTGKTGAAKMAAIAAVRAGAGLVTVAVPDSIAPAIESFTLEAMTFPLASSHGTLSAKCIQTLVDLSNDKSTILIGPGISTSMDNFEIISKLLSVGKVPVIIDADGLNSICSDLSVLKKRSCDIIITPHSGEMGRLLGISAADVERNRIDVAVDFARKYNVYTILKGSKTILAMPDGNAFISPFGNPGMATGGSGDVLSGIIGGFICSGVQLSDALTTALIVHGKAGDLASEKYGQRSLAARDIIEGVITVIKEFEANGTKILFKERERDRGNWFFIGG